MPDFVNPFAGVTPERKMTKREVTRAIRLSLAAEEEATHLYEAIADATDDPLVRKVMQDIANEERVHVGEFQHLLRKLLPDEEGFLQDGATEVNEMAEEVAQGNLSVATPESERPGPVAEPAPLVPSIGNLKA